MESAIKDLAQFNDTQLFETVSEGTTHIVNNVSRLNTAAQKLNSVEDYHTSRILRHFATEEAAKVLVLLDAVRCPKEKQKEKAQTLKCFNDHVGKGIYAKACEWRPANFQDMRSYVEEELVPFYLDGPRGYDWIFQNDIVQSRENLIYVDYIREITGANEPQERYWVYPYNDRYNIDGFFDYHTPASVTLALALHRANVTTVTGLRIIAEIWRSFIPTTTTHISELIDKNRITVNTLYERGVLDENKLETDDQIPLLRWMFPLWRLRVHREPMSRKDQKANLKKLREQRKKLYDWRREIEARREPPPAISKAKIESLSKIYWDAEEEREDLLRATHQSSNSTSRKIKFISLGDLNYDDLPSWQRLKRMLRESTEEERIALLALAWYVRNEIVDWPYIYKHAQDTVKSVNENYIAGLGSYWLSGYTRWATKPSLE